ncbi:MAG: hypothetical protein KDB23_33830, partial [Planctomycetales bacterium]|nr:hypothetical protein [Planctomycetales bacterium]
VYGQMPALAANHGGAQVLIASVAFAFQIYGDFAGYSTIAMGAARLMGIRLTLNFDTPEFSQNPAELWRRWHSTLNRWLRDYVYIPLGGSKLGPFAKYFNLFMVFLLTGLWHGANWTFVLWGAWMGAWIIGHQLLLPYLPKLPENTSKSIVIPVRALKMIGVYGCFGLSATLFRAYDIEHSYLLWRSMLDFPWNLSDSIMNVPAAGPFFIEFLQKIVILLLIDF